MSSDIPDGFPVTLPKEALAGLDGVDITPEERLPPGARPDPTDPPGRERPAGGGASEAARGGDAAGPSGASPDSAALRPLILPPPARAHIRSEIERAGGREVCFLADVDEERGIRDPRAVARGNFAAVLVAAKDAPVGGVMIHNHPGGALEPSDADMRVAAQLYEEGLGTAIVDNRAERMYVVVEPPAPRRRVRLDVDDLASVLAPGGTLSDRYEAYEDRPGQREMLGVVSRRFNEGGIAIVEAGTGTGKSLAYLLPAVRWAQNNAERTVVSTNTINLQEQLSGKDLPLVQELLGDVDWALVKGRGNYISIRRALLAQESQASLFDEDRSEELRELRAWIGATEDGSLSDLGFRPSSDTWEEVRSDPDICLRARCPHFQDCFYQKARRRAASAQLLVVNHHLLFTDLAVRRATNNYTQSAVLPAYRKVILDEAHNVEDAATSHLGVEITRRGLFRALSRLDRRGRGILTAIHDAVGEDETGPGLRERLENRVRPALSRLRAEVEGFLERLEPLAPAGAGAVRLGIEGRGEPADDPDVAERLRATLAGLGTLERELAELRARLELSEALAERLEGRILDLRSIERRLAAAVHGLRLVLAPGDEATAFVRWMETRGRGKRANLVLAAAPIELGGLLRESLFSRAETTVLTSATLTTRARFDFLRGRMGITDPELDAVEEEVEVDERIVLSPFDFANQTLLVVPADMPDAGGGGGGEAGRLAGASRRGGAAGPPGGDGRGGRAPEGRGGSLDEATVDVLARFAALTDGGLFALFTSYTALRAVARGARAMGLDAEWPLFVQGEDDRHRMLDRFVRAGNGLLLGTTSFWEGVDVPGDPLRGLLIQKLPFRVPTEPITQARMEALERRGVDPFRHFMLPQAALRLKQGFGRLVRSRTDRGAVVLLDKRILTKRYGRYLRDSLPPAPLVKGPWNEVERRLRAFYG